VISILFLFQNIPKDHETYSDLGAKNTEIQNKHIELMLLNIGT